MRRRWLPMVIVCLHQEPAARSRVQRPRVQRLVPLPRHHRALVLVHAAQDHVRHGCHVCRLHGMQRRLVRWLLLEHVTQEEADGLALVQHRLQEVGHQVAAREPLVNGYREAARSNAGQDAHIACIRGAHVLQLASACESNGGLQPAQSWHTVVQVAPVHNPVARVGHDGRAAAGDFVEHVHHGHHAHREVRPGSDPFDFPPVCRREELVQHIKELVHQSLQLIGHDLLEELHQRLKVALEVIDHAVPSPVRIIVQGNLKHRHRGR
mmetsp:Transcript_17157/g.55116  ORF Transcript_17157/g.55116 Transcript_17157/m.55116 type:complete len:266 (-) Transcript_17157:241-1038(-)